MTYHPHLIPSYYPVYHQHPSYFLSVGPQPPISPSLSPTLSTASSSSAVNTSAQTQQSQTQQQQQQRILPKSPATTPNPSAPNTTTNAATTTTPTAAASLAPTFNYFPYPIQVSPQLHPTSNSPLQPAQNPGNLSPVPFHPIGAAAIRHNSISSSTTTTTTTADQREQARKVSHSAIERRRRERINDKISQLKDLIPACSDRENLHKMTILQSAIDYITYLKKVVDDLENNNNNDHGPQQDIPISPKMINDTKDDKEEVEEEDEDAWSASPSPIPTQGLKPMDLIKMNKKSNTSTTTTPPPTIIIHDNSSQESSSAHAPTTTTTTTSTAATTSYTSSNVDRHMNLENILC